MAPTSFPRIAPCRTPETGGTQSLRTAKYGRSYDQARIMHYAFSGYRTPITPALPSIPLTLSP
ncbi:MAG: hypothetical protein PHY78_14775, partial [Desulfobacterales bacterium]|nr:hypothetical protein [Desulfobacterales bacterium]